MRKSIKTIGTIVTITIVMICAYLLGTTQTETVTGIKEVVKTVEVVPANYIDTTSEEFYNNYVDMRQVKDFVVNNE